MNNEFDLERFVSAQRNEIENVRVELGHGSKRGHWMWFIFPQMAGLGRSSMASHYAISCLAEAKAYLQHSIVGPRLVECTQLVNLVEGRSIERIFGEIDALKFRSSMTLFAQAATDKSVFERALDKYFGGRADELTLDLLKVAATE